MPSDQSPDANPRHLSSLEESATREIAAELAGIKQRLNRLAQPTGATPSVIARTTAPAQSPAPTPPPAQATAPTATSPIALMTRASALKYAPIKWLWPGRIAGAKLTLLAGTPGSGKSTLAMSLIAAVTTGGSYPCDEGSAPDASVILVAPGGDPDVLVPRLKAAGADLEQVHIITHVPKSDGRRAFDLNTDLQLLDSAIRSLKQRPVVVVDAVNLSGGRAAEQTTRSVLDRLALIANYRDVTVVALVQIAGADRGARKPPGLDALTLGTARAAFVIEADPADENRKLLLQAKNELTRDPGTLAFRITAQETETDQTAARIEFEPQYHSLRRVNSRRARRAASTRHERSQSSSCASCSAAPAS